MFPDPKVLIRYIATMTIAVVVLGTFLRLATRCDVEVLRSLDLHKIMVCATMY
jgi:hypothetical protein